MLSLFAIQIGTMACGWSGPKRGLGVGLVSLPAEFELGSPVKLHEGLFSRNLTVRQVFRPGVHLRIALSPLVHLLNRIFQLKPHIMHTKQKQDKKNFLYRVACLRITKRESLLFLYNQAAIKRVIFKNYFLFS